MGRSSRRAAVTIGDVARAAGVSRATAARALGGYGQVSQRVHEQVTAAARELGYQPNALARNMSTGRTQSLGVAIANIDDPFYARLTRGITDVARAEGLEVLVANTDEDPELERRAVQVFQANQLEGILLTPAPTSHAEHLIAANEQGTPVVLMDRHPRGLELDAVVVDNREATRRAIHHLLDAGHTRIAFVAGGGRPDAREESPRPSPDSSDVALAATTLERIDGYRAALAERNIPADSRYLRCGDFHREAAKAEAHQLLALDEPPTAIFAAGSIPALGTVEAIYDSGLRIPDDLSVIAFDDADWSNVVQPPLTAISQPAYDVGALATRTLLQRIRGDDSPPVVHVLDTELRNRKSVAEPRTASRRPTE
ncbi:LacI family DNA-binding transcriptional regulator [Saccharopolyspora sp. NPDC049357]|uniref:LacI family DNA-binding transcriptional regulator n=1 Tax=Saccharopolyspora sp. NPDC049357 TaxID=3154507 RepID=UPI0034461CC9